MPEDLDNDWTEEPSEREALSRPYKRQTQLSTEGDGGSILKRNRTNLPILLKEDQDPITILSQAFDLFSIANAILHEEFDFSELPIALIDIFRNDPDPKVRMQASDRLLRLVKDAMIAHGAVGKVVESAKIRSPDGTTAERSVVTRQIMRSFEEASPNVRRVENVAEVESKPPPPGIAGQAPSPPSAEGEGEGGSAPVAPVG